MLIVCPSCEAQYQVAESAIPPEGREVQCSSCQNIWHQEPKSAVSASKPVAIQADEFFDDEPEVDDLADHPDETEAEAEAEAEADSPADEGTDQVDDVDSDDDGTDSESAPKLGGAQRDVGASSQDDSLSIRADRVERLSGAATEAQKTKPAKPTKPAKDEFRVPPPPPDFDPDSSSETPPAMTDEDVQDNTSETEVSAKNKESEPESSEADEGAEDQSARALAEDESDEEHELVDFGDTDEAQADIAAVFGPADEEDDGAEPDEDDNSENAAEGFAPIQKDQAPFQRSVHPQMDEDSDQPRAWDIVPDEGQEDTAESATSTTDAEEDDSGFVWEEPEDATEFDSAAPDDGWHSPEETSSKPEPEVAKRKLTEAIAELKAAQQSKRKSSGADVDPVALDEVRRARSEAAHEDSAAQAAATTPAEQPIADEALLNSIRSELSRSEKNNGRGSIDNVRASLVDNRSSSRSAKTAKTGKRTVKKEAGKAPSRGGALRLGFRLGLLICVVFAGVYLLAPNIITFAPALEGTVNVIVNIVDSLRGLVSSLLG